MSTDRIINKGSLIEKSEIGKAIDGFFGKWPGDIQWRGDRFFIEIPGAPAYTGDPVYREERFIEVWRSACSVDVITRQADPLVMSIADGLAKYIALSVGGKLEMG